MKARWLLFLLVTFQLCGQTSFLSSHIPFGEENVRSGLAVAVIDLNGDHLDDIVSLDRLNHLKVFYQLLNSEDFYFKDFGKVSTSDQLSISVADLDNDGIREVIFGGFYDGLKIFKKFDGSGTYLRFGTTATDFYTQNISTVDFNSDGLLDIYVNDDDGPPRFFENTMTNDFTAVDVIDFQKEGEAASGNYGSIWTDFDLDSDLDLYISKCRLGVDDSTDSRRINQLYENREGNFMEVAAEYELASGEQTWVTNFVDLDNDLDFDVVMINHTGGNEIYENRGEGQYVKREISSEWNRIFEGLQLIVKDFDNDGFKDILIGGVKSKLFWNKGGFIFEEDQGLLQGREATSLSVGDLNYDGYLDLYASYAENQIQENRYIADEVHFNQGNDNSYVKITLEASAGNRDAIGAKAFLYDSETSQLLEVRSGDSYGINNSLDLNFGILKGNLVDSLIIKWSSGLTEEYYNIDLNKHYIIKENGCILENVKPNFPSSEINCEERPFFLEIENVSDVIWSDGSTDKILEIHSSGYYNATVTNEDGCENVSGLIKVVNESDFTLPDIELIDPMAGYCKDEGVVVRSDYKKLRWSNGVETMYNYTLIEEPIFVDYEICNEYVMSSVLELPVLRVDTPKYIVDTIINGEEATFLADGNEISWYASMDAIDPIHVGGEFNAGLIINDSTLFADNRVDFVQYDSVGYEFDESSVSFPGNNINGGLVFSVGSYQTSLMSVQCYTDIAALRKFQVKDYWGNVIAEKEVLVSPENSNVELNFTLNPSPYYLLTTDLNHNLQELGTRSPRLLRSTSEGNIYPILSKKSNVDLLGSTGTSDVYYSFYDLIFEDYDMTCNSERVEVTVVVEQESGVDITDLEVLLVSPNPVGESLRIDVDHDFPLSYEVYNGNGIKVLLGELVGNEIRVAELLAGFYILRIDGRAIRFVKD